MELPVAIHRVRAGAEEFRVVRPGRPPTHAVLLDHDRHLDLYLDASAARTLAALWMLAARSPHSLIHLPVRANRLPAHGVPDDVGFPLDLVLLHHSLQFAPARWKGLRRRLGPGLPQTASLPEVEREQTAVAGAARHHRENHDLFHQHLHAETLFMTGSAKVFRETARHFLDVAREGPVYVPTHPRRPCYETVFHSNDGILGNAREIRVEYCDQWLP
ncbi:hypothetical protein [Streptomyces sp. NBC_00102]|uniref:hypothetical protein n=1 Tax=Streptomyces sp. NBC_00102 TaxID=2975652 RepID=UPI002255752B|nr:hypothetical protein [Streptomyces sp. NBC_00102]MCX5399290.1 hypothetical protein [Streptomyces sp. NBC_00102]